MKRVLITQAGLLVLTLLLSLSAAASWNPFVNMGSTTVGPNPTCASATSQHATCAAIGLNHTLLVDQFNGTNWSGWVSLGGSFVDSPSCTADGAGRVICAARGTKQHPLCHSLEWDLMEHSDLRWRTSDLSSELRGSGRRTRHVQRPQR